MQSTRPFDKLRTGLTSHKPALSPLSLGQRTRGLSKGWTHGTVEPVGGSPVTPEQAARRLVLWGLTTGPYAPTGRMSQDLY